MKNEERIIELLTEMVLKQDVFADELREVKHIQQRQEKHMEKILVILSDDVLDLKEGKQIVLKKHR